MKKKISLWLPVSVFLAFSVFFYGPLGIYLSNSEELWFGLGDVLKITGLVSLTVLAVLMALGLALPEKISVFLAKLVFGIALALYVQGNFININYGVLDGTEVAWTSYRRYAVLDTLAWILCIHIPFILNAIPQIRKVKYDRKIVSLLSLAIIAMQLPALAVQLINYTPKEDQSVQITTEGIYELSSKENMIVFVLDTYDEAYFQEFMDQNPEYVENLRDFVHYDNYMSSAGRTIVAMPSLLTGQVFKRETVYTEYIKKIWDEKNVLEDIAKNGVDVRVFSETPYFSTKTPEFISNLEVEDTLLGSNRVLCKKLYKLTGSIFAPHLIKPYLWFNTAEFDDAKKSVNSYKMDDIQFIANYREEQFSLNNSYDRAFRLYHLDGTHSPFRMAENGTKSGDATRESQTKALMILLSEMLADMKAKGVYDDATIVITADHGNLNLTEHSVFLLKERNHSGEYITSHAPLSGFDLPVLVGDVFGVSAENEYGMHLSDITEITRRERHFFQNTSDSSRIIIKEFKTASDVSDKDALISVGRYEDDSGQPYVLGTELSFEADATGNRYAVSGFEINTGWRTLLCGHEAVIQIPIADLPDTGTVTVHVGVFTDDSKSRPAVFYVNDSEFFNGEVNKAQNKTGVEFEVPVELLRTAEGNIFTLRMVLSEIPEDDETTRSFSLKRFWITTEPMAQ